MEEDARKYFYIAQGQISIDNVDDCEEMKMTDEAFNILNFTQVIIVTFILINLISF